MTSSRGFRADHIGSLLRPQALLEARRRRDAATISADELRAVEDQAIAAAVKGQQEAGIDVITDGEFRRRDFRTGFVEAVDGIEMRSFDMTWHAAGGATKLRSNAFVITGRLRQRSRLAAGEASYVKGLTAGPVKVTLIAPGFLVDRFWQEG
jgi:5-methyltetrahydropteroyltriglutamate--homocysteine methyltransferase